jgi:hypothetical protein
MEEDFDFEETVTTLIREAEWKTVRREAAQQAVGRVVGRAGRFNGDDVPKILKAYNEEMHARGVGGALKLEYFGRVVADPIRAEVKELREAHESWRSFEGALLKAYGYVEPEEEGRREFDRWVASAKRHRSAMEALREFERRFSQLSEWERRSVGADKVRLFLKTVHHEERMDILLELQDDDGAHGLTEDWSEVERVCRQHASSRSATTSAASDRKEKAASVYALPPVETSTRAGSEELDLVALIRESCELLMAQFEAEEESGTDSGPSGSVDEAYGEAGRDRYDGTTGEGAVQATLSACGERTAVDEAGDYEFRTHRSGTSYGRASGIGACATGDELATDGDVRTEVATDTTIGGAVTFPTLVLGTTAAGARARVRPRVTDGGGGGEAGDHGDGMGEGAGQATLSSCGKRTAAEEADSYGVRSATQRVGECFRTRRPETLYEEFASILGACEIELDDEEETSGGAATLHTSFLGTTAAGASASVRPRVTDDGGGKADDGGYDEDCSGQQEDPSTPGPETSAVARGCGCKTGEKGGGREEAGPGEDTLGEEAGPGMGTYGRPGGKAGRRAKRNPTGRDQSGRGWSQHDRKPRCARWEPASERGPSRLGKDDSVGDREREEPSTPIREALAVTERRKSDGTVGGGEELEDGAESDIGAGIRCDGRAGQDGKPELGGATATEDVETDAEFGSTGEERNGRHAIRPMEGQETGMHADGAQQGTDGDGRTTRTEESTSKSDTTESDTTRSGREIVGRHGTTARSEKRPEEDLPHLSGRRRQLRNNVSPTEWWVATRSRRPTRSPVPEWTSGAEMRASRPETRSRSQEVERVCRQHASSRSATTSAASDRKEKAASVYALPPVETSTRAGSEELDLVALIRESCELLMAQFEAEEESGTDSGPSGSVDEAYGEAGRDRYDGTTGEGAVQATLSACGERTAVDEAGDYEFRTHRSGTSYGRASGIGACATGDELATDGDVRTEVATDTTIGGAVTFPTLVLGTTAAGARARVRPRVTDGGGGGEAGDHGDGMGEGAGQATLSSCGKRTAAEEADSYGVRSATQRVGECFRTRRPETLYEEFASILGACEIELDDEEETSGGAATLHTSFLGTTAAGASASVRPRVTDDGGGKADDGGYDEDCSGQQEDPSTPGPETSAVARGCGCKTGEKGGGREEAGPGEDTLGEEAGPGMGTYGRPGGKAGRRAKRNPTGRDQSGRGWSQHDRKPRCARWEPASERGPSRLGKDDSVGDREREEPSTPIREALAVTERRKSDGTVGGGEELEDGAESDIGAGIRCDGRAGQDGKPELGGATATEDVETDAEFGSTGEERNGRHAIRPMEGQETGMHADGAQQGTDGDGRTTRTEESTSKSDTTESDTTRSGREIVGRHGTTARSEKRPEEDLPHLSGRRRQLRNNVSPTEWWVATRSRRPTRSRVPEWTYGAEMRASRPETRSRSKEGLRRWKTERPTRKSERRRTFTKRYAEGSGKRNARWGHRGAKARARLWKVVSSEAKEVRVNGGPRDT